METLEQEKRKISTREWHAHLLEQYYLEKGRRIQIDTPQFETWLKKLDINRLLRWIEKLENDTSVEFIEDDIMEQS